jgi:hypothetical protein
VPAGTSIWSVPGEAFASMTAARRVHSPAPEAHTPLPGVASGASFTLSTTKVLVITGVLLLFTGAAAASVVGTSPARTRAKAEKADTTTAHNRPRSKSDVGRMRAPAGLGA